MKLGKTEVWFVAGTERPSYFPRGWDKFLKRTGLDHRFAVIQHTLVEGCVDMYFDQLLLKRLIEWIEQVHPTGAISVVERADTLDAKGIPLDAFLADWSSRSDDEKCPPAFVKCEVGGSIEIVLATEFWAQLGGPAPYSDSYTYSAFSRQDVSQDIRNFLTASPSASHWNMETTVRSASDSQKLRPLWQRLLRSYPFY